MKLGVFYEDSLTGEIEQTENGSMQFRYDTSWLAKKETFALSYSLPKENKLFTKEADFFFSNYLPEGPVRQAICEKQGISIDNDFVLLKQIGGECAGALVIDETPPRPTENTYEDLSSEKLAELVSRENVFATLTEKENMRLSLAGAQDKLPVYLSEANKVKLPLGAAPSNHILKFANPRFAGLVLNEYFTTLLVRKLGLDTVEVSLMPVGKEPILVVKRYDRIKDQKITRRIHQEDACQALGVSHKKKYEKEEGPSLAQVYGLITNASDSPLIDNERLLRWQMTNVFVGNCDGHAKNISLLRTQTGEWRLAPFYDMVCTLAYPNLSKDLAMSIAGTADIGNIREVHWRKLANEIKVSWKVVESLFSKFVEDFPKALVSANEEVLKETGEHPIFKKITECLTKNYRTISKRWNEKR